MTDPENLLVNLDDLEARLVRLWGKTSSEPTVFHPALYHMLDVGHVARHLLGERATARWRRVLAHALNVEADTLDDWRRGSWLCTTSARFPFPSRPRAWPSGNA